MADNQSPLGDLIPQVTELIRHLQTIRKGVETCDLAELPGCPTTSYLAVENRLHKCIKKLNTTVAHTAFMCLMGQLKNSSGDTIYSIDEDMMRSKCLAIVDHYIMKAELMLKYCQESDFTKVFNISNELAIAALKTCRDILQMCTLPELIMKVKFVAYTDLHPFYALMLRIALHYKKLQDMPDVSPAA